MEKNPTINNREGAIIWYSRVLGLPKKIELFVVDDGKFPRASTYWLILQIPVNVTQDMLSYCLTLFRLGFLGLLDAGGGGGHIVPPHNNF